MNIHPAINVLVTSRMHPSDSFTVVFRQPRAFFSPPRYSGFIDLLAHSVRFRSDREQSEIGIFKIFSWQSKN